MCNHVPIEQGGRDGGVSAPFEPALPSTSLITGRIFSKAGHNDKCDIDRAGNNIDNSQIATYKFSRPIRLLTERRGRVKQWWPTINVFKVPSWAFDQNRSSKERSLRSEKSEIC